MIRLSIVFDYHSEVAAVRLCLMFRLSNHCWKVLDFEWVWKLWILWLCKDTTQLVTYLTLQGPMKEKVKSFNSPPSISLGWWSLRTLLCTLNNPLSLGELTNNGFKNCLTSSRRWTVDQKVGFCQIKNIF